MASKSFTDSLLSRFNASTRQAKLQREQRERAAAEAKLAEQRKQVEALKQSERDRVSKVLARKAYGKPKRKPMKKTHTSRGEGSSTVARKAANAALREKREREYVKKRNDLEGPPKPLPGMEFVVRKTTKKRTIVPHSSDYSDLFGDKYLKGVETDITKSMAKDTAKAVEKNKKIMEEKKEKLERTEREAREDEKRKMDLLKKGKISSKERRKFLSEISSRDWVAVDAPVTSLKEVKKGRAKILSGEIKPIKRDTGLTESDKKLKLKIEARHVQEKKKKLHERIASMGGASSSKSSPKSSQGSAQKSHKRARSYDESEDEIEERRPVLKKQRRRSSERHSSERRFEDSDDGYDRYRRREPTRSAGRDRHARNDRGYNSDEWSDGRDDDSDEEDLFDISALEREEERSSKWARIEDKKELNLEKKRKKEKEARRKAFESKHGYADDESD